MDKVSTIAGQSNGRRRAHRHGADDAGPLGASDLAGSSARSTPRSSRTSPRRRASSPPGKLRTQHAHLIESLQLRVSGVQGLAKALGKVNAKTKETVEAAVMTQQVYRLLTSDVVWDDLFQAPVGGRARRRKGVRQVTVPSSHFLAAAGPAHHR